MRRLRSPWRAAQVAFVAFAAWGAVNLAACSDAGHGLESTATAGDPAVEPADSPNAAMPAPTTLGSAARVVGSAVPVPTVPPLGTDVVGASVPLRRVEVVRVLPHDPTAFTQGLVYLPEGRLLESTGLYGQSSLREVDLETGRVLRRRDLPPDLFGEGLALVGDRLLQLTWREEIALEHALSDFRLVDSHRYEGEGWGLCFDGRRLVMSDGSERLTFRDPETFAPIGTVTVTAGAQPVRQLNELECAGERVYANVWQTDRILEIVPETGAVVGAIDASGLLAPEEAARADVLNGIAYVPARDTFLITGKLWPKLFEVRFTPTADQ